MSTTVTELTPSNFSENITTGTVLVDFWAPWCMPCLMQIPILESVAKRIGDNAVVAKINVEDFPELAEPFAINGIPTLLLFKEGEIIERFSGVQTEDILVDTLLNTDSVK
ncbi:MAG: thioredoxin [Candidatus Hydrogenedentes bacterium]|nr:thioredoxin [Candidatus Hydrogenedentota bacterium]